MRWTLFRKSKPKLKRDYEEEQRQIEALKETQRKNQEWQKIEDEKKALKEGIRKAEVEKRRKQLEPFKKFKSAAVKELVVGGKFAWKEFKKSKYYKRKHHRKHKKPKYKMARYIK